MQRAARSMTTTTFANTQTLSCRRSESDTRLRRACRASRDTRVAREYAWNEKNMKVVRRNSVSATTLRSPQMWCPLGRSIASPRECAVFVAKSQKFHAPL